jgi:hypothetical protein
VLLLLGCAGGDVPQNRILRFVDELTFGGPFDEHVPQDEKLVRWTDDLRIALAGPGVEQTRERGGNGGFSDQSGARAVFRRHQS